MASILVIDDEVALLKGLERALKTRGHTVVTETTGERAISNLSENEYDLIVLDLILPDLDGFEVLQRIENFPNRPKILVFSGGGPFGSPEVLLRAARQLGANAVLEKPVSLKDFLAQVDDLLTVS